MDELSLKYGAYAAQEKINLAEMDVFAQAKALEELHKKVAKDKDLWSRKVQQCALALLGMGWSADRLGVDESR